MQEDVERLWFRRVISAVLLVTLTWGSVPLIKNFIYPTQTRR